ncbi:MAG TPA: GNAT family N-acetyltransferase [Candidatus Nanopelagicales bacterium]|nr:GNAT family N-acetyltransferase [Candidatus Nanopelagicales bacterium]
MNVGPDFSRDATLADGTHVILRMIQPGDRDEVRRQFRRLSPEARYRRFHALAHDLSDDALRYLTEVDGVNHVAIVAIADSHDLKQDVGLGIGRFVRLQEEPSVAEAAVTVMDEAQRKGLGRLLLATLVEAARERGIREFRATVLAENEPIRHMLDAAGAKVREQDGDSLVFDVPIDEAPPEDGGPPSGVDHRDHPLRRLLRSAAQSLLEIRSSIMGG